jgi:solute carrier family 25 (mitochondrial iron transporter), member 28/37
MDAVKQKMQISRHGYMGMVDCVRKTLRREGLRRGLYAGYTTTITMNVPYVAVYFTSYESLKTLMAGDDEEARSYSYVHLSAGAGAGILSAAFTTPLDVAKTRLQTQNETNKHYRGMTDALKRLWAEEVGSRCTCVCVCMRECVSEIRELSCQCG